MSERIINQLKTIEINNDVKVVYACESGSRAWGFPSSDSDYDVRFLYLKPIDWYLSIDLESRQDVIELPIEADEDINGWDLRKALNLFKKSNPPLLEWLSSPIVYLERFEIANRMRELAPIYYNPIACMYHYLHMAQGNNRLYLKGERVWIKKYFYVLRPILAINWLERGFGVVPMEFRFLVARTLEKGPLRNKIDELIEAKKAGQELDYGPRIPEMSDFIDNELDRFEKMHFESALQRKSSADLDSLFIQALKEAWE